MAKVVTRDVGPFLAKVRDFLIGRKHMNNLRFPVRIYRWFSFYQSTFLKRGSLADLRFQDKDFFWPSLTFKEIYIWLSKKPISRLSKKPTSDFQKVNFQCQESSQDFFIQN